VGGLCPVHCTAGTDAAAGGTVVDGAAVDAGPRPRVVVAPWATQPPRHASASSSGPSLAWSEAVQGLERLPLLHQDVRSLFVRLDQDAKCVGHCMAFAHRAPPYLMGRRQTRHGWVQNPRRSSAVSGESWEWGGEGG
jgi:hypothetical protein